MSSDQTQGAAPVDARRRTVYFFATCVIDLFSPDSGLDAVEVLERLGVDVVFPLGQTCCGQPAYTTGFPADARAVVAAQLRLFDQPWPVVVASGSCGGMLKHHWPRLFADDLGQLALARDIANRTVEFTEFVASLPGATELLAANNRPASIALHTSCSARREMATHLHARALLKRLPGVTLLTQSHESECCGFGGTFSVKHPEISAAMAQDKVEAILQTGCEQLLSADCGCLMNINGTLQRQQKALRGQHIASFLKARLEPAP